MSVSVSVNVSEGSRQTPEVFDLNQVQARGLVSAQMSLNEH
jgi:hypothetical protein